MNKSTLLGDMYKANSVLSFVLANLRNFTGNSQAAIARRCDIRRDQLIKIESRQGIALLPLHIFTKIFKVYRLGWEIIDLDVNGYENYREELYSLISNRMEKEEDFILPEKVEEKSELFNSLSAIFVEQVAAKKALLGLTTDDELVAFLHKSTKLSRSIICPAIYYNSAPLSLFHNQKLLSALGRNIAIRVFDKPV